MEKIFVADSYKNMEIIGEPFQKEENGRLYVKVKGKCPRCNGLGIIASRVENGRIIPIPVDGGICYKCGGARYETKTVRAYTEKEYEALEKAKDKARETREKAREAKIQERIDNAEKYKHEAALKLGFSEDEKVYLVYGDDTFSIKDKLKELGARFDPTLKWYFSKEVELPEGYSLCEMTFDELYDYVPEVKWAQFKENAKEIVIKRLAVLKGPSTSVYYPANEGDRVRNITAKLTNVRGFEGVYGYTSVYTFTSGDYVFVWMTTSTLAVAVGDVINLTGTIKKFDEYLGVKNTYLTRCIVKVIGG